MTIDDILDAAVDRGYARSSFVLYVYLTSFADLDTVQILAGTYVFSEPLSAAGLVHELIDGDAALKYTRLTIPEGTPNRMIATLAAELLPNVDPVEFLRLASTSEGQLFPDTYFVPVSFSAADLFALLTETHTTKLAATSRDQSESTLTDYEILVLASILEREANDEASMKIVSGILQNRLRIDMPLQADATIEYDLDKPLSELTAADLESNSPYNTYTNRGLPPTPIGNPGLTAIRAALAPTESDYFFYITAPDGTFYYAKTFDEHRANIERYLR